MHPPSISAPRRGAVLFVSLITTTGSVAHAGVVSANNIADDWSSSSFAGSVGFTDNDRFANTARSQFFTAGAGGLVETLTTIFRAGHNGGPTVALRVAIHEAAPSADATAPGQQVGGAVLVDPGVATGSDAMVHIDFGDAGVVLEAGRGYHAVFTAETPIADGSQYIFAYMNPTALNFGQSPNFSPDAGLTWRDPSLSAEEIGLRVEVVPSPGAAAVVGLGVLVASRRRRG